MDTAPASRFLDADLVATAIALGEPVAAPAGTVVWAASVKDDSYGEEDFLGLFVDEQAAKERLAIVLLGHSWAERADFFEDGDDTVPLEALDAIAAEHPTPVAFTDVIEEILDRSGDLQMRCFPLAVQGAPRTADTDLDRVLAGYASRGTAPVGSDVIVAGWIDTSTSEVVRFLGAFADDDTQRACLAQAAILALAAAGDGPWWYADDEAPLHPQLDPVTRHARDGSLDTLAAAAMEWMRTTYPTTWFDELLNYANEFSMAYCNLDSGTFQVQDRAFPEGTTQITGDMLNNLFNSSKPVSF